MVLKQTWVNLTDSSLVQWVKVFHLYGGFNRKFSSVGYYIKGSVRILKPIYDYYKGYQIKRINKGKVTRSLIIRQVYKFKKKDYLYIQFRKNSSILVKKKNTFISKYLVGPGISVFRNKRLLTLFKKAL